MPFGKNQLNQPTPASIERGLKIMVALSGVIITAVQSANFMPDKAADVICWILGLVISISTVLTPFFGVDVKPDESIPANEVTAMEQHNEKV